MPSKSISFTFRLPDELLARFRAFCEGRGEDVSANLRAAMERHMAYPPPAADRSPAPLPTAPEHRPPRKAKGRD